MNLSGNGQTFIKKPQGCGDVQTVSAKVTYKDEGDYRTATAYCLFNGKTYTTVRTARILFDVKVENNVAGTISVSDAKAKAGDKIKVTLTPNKGYFAESFTVTADDGAREINTDKDSFIMPEGSVTIKAEFKAITPQNEPFIDSNGEYHLGTVEYAEIDGEPYSVNEDGTIGEALDSIELSYFDFALINNDSEYQINYYTGPTDNLFDLVIPKTFNGKPVTVLGVDNTDPFINYGGKAKTQFDLILNENIREIKDYSFYALWVKKVTGNTSGLKKIGGLAFSWANSPGGYKLDIKLDYEGSISTGAGLFNNMNVTARIRHTTRFSRSDLSQKSLSFIFTDKHIYSSPVREWSDDYSSATATFTCTDSRCKHSETVNAEITADDQRDKTIYTATLQFEGETYTDTKTVNKALSNVIIADTEHGTVTADKTEAYEGEPVTLTVTPDTNYKLSALTVKDENNQDIEITDGIFLCQRVMLPLPRHSAKSNTR